MAWRGAGTWLIRLKRDGKHIGVYLWNGDRLFKMPLVWCMSMGRWVPDGLTVSARLMVDVEVVRGRPVEEPLPGERRKHAVVSGSRSRAHLHGRRLR